jgi:hypothetical protein
MLSQIPIKIPIIPTMHMHEINKNGTNDAQFLDHNTKPVTQTHQKEKKKK